MAFNIDAFVKKQNTVLQQKAGGFDVNKFLISKGITPKVDLKTAQGLETLAQAKGLQRQAEQITKVGEQPERIFSGGPVMDIFDALNTLQHGTVGIVQGKGFREGVRTRASFTKGESFKDKGLVGLTTGLALDIALDPLTYMGGFGLLGKASEAVKATKGFQKVSQVVKESKVGQFLGSKFVYRFGQDPIYAKIAERTNRNIAVGNQNLLNLARPLTKLDPQSQRLIAEARKAEKLEDLPPELLARAKPAFDELDRLGNEAVKVGLLSKKTYEENVGRYIARLYRKHEIPQGGIEKLKTSFDKKPLRVDLSRFMKRKDIPDDVREAMGEILEAGYPTAKALLQINQAVERTKFFNIVAKRWGKEAVEEGLERLPITKRLGVASGKFVPKPIFDDIQEILRVKDAGIASKLVAGFKFGKVVMNPATHARNILSNFILNDFEGLSPLRLDIYAKAAKELATKGKFYQEAQKVGLGLNTFASQELKAILNNAPEATNFVRKAGRQVIDKLSDLYGKEEEYAKLAQFIFQRGKGLDIEDAWKVAEQATFNYSQVTPFIRKMRESIFGYPFITFTYKATPQVAKTILTKPTKLSNLGKIKTAIESASDQKELIAERAVEPDYIRDGLFIRLPKKDKYGRHGYFDLTYIIPMGDLFTGQFIQQEKEGETLSQSALRKLPFFSIISDLAQNKDFFGNPIVKGNSIEPWQQGADIMKYLTKSYGPPIALDFPGRVKRSLEFERTVQEQPPEIQKRTTRTVDQEIRRGVFGLKETPFNIEREQSKRENEKRQRLIELLEAERVLKKFEVPYIPKKKNQ